MDNARFKIHFSDDFGPATVFCETEAQFNEVLGNINNDPKCEDVWCEYYDAEEGWQA